MTFLKNNRIQYGQDFSFYCGIPAGVNFSVRKCSADGRYDLIAPGYGAPGDYGNGSLHVWGLTRVQRRRFDKNCSNVTDKQQKVSA